MPANVNFAKLVKLAKWFANLAMGLRISQSGLRISQCGLRISQCEISLRF